MHLFSLFYAVLELKFFVRKIVIVLYFYTFTQFLLVHLFTWLVCNVYRKLLTLSLIIQDHKHSWHTRIFGLPMSEGGKIVKDVLNR